MKFKLILVVAGSLVTLPTLAQTVTIKNTSPTATEVARTYWTPERMGSAKPLDLGVVGSPAGNKVPAAAVPAAPGPPKVACDAEPCQLPQNAVEEMNFGGVSPLDGSYPGPHTTFGNLLSQTDPTPYAWFPNSGPGVLFFHDPVGGGDFRCSASSLYAGAALNGITTAGHCVANGGQSQFYNNWLYCPGYKAGPNPNRGCWSWLSASVTIDWFANRAFSRDVATINLQHTGTVLSEDVVTAVGGFGFAWNWGRDQHWDEIGYPVEAITGWPFDGNYQWRTETEHRYDVSTDGFGPDVNSIGSPQTPGASGSPVLLFWNKVPGGGYVNGVISFYFSAGPNGNELGHELQFAYFDTFICNELLKPATGWGGSC